MTMSIAIVGSGPTALYILKHLLNRDRVYNITIFEKSATLGAGYPYGEENNTNGMLANISSIEIPPLLVSYYDWLMVQSEEILASWEMNRGTITERGYYPRLALGAYFSEQFNAICELLRQKNHAVTINTNTLVTDILPTLLGATITTSRTLRDADRRHYDFVIIATGHQFSEASSKNDSELVSWTQLFHDIENLDLSDTGIMGCSLSAIDAAVLIAQRFGAFEGTEYKLKYVFENTKDKFTISMMAPHSPIDLKKSGRTKRLIKQVCRITLDEIWK